MAENISIHTDYITLGQFAKLTHLIQSGGEEKTFVHSHEITVDGVKEDRRGRKLRVGNKVTIDGKDYLICESKA
jgi:ribosome-associated protein